MKAFNFLQQTVHQIFIRPRSFIIGSFGIFRRNPATVRKIYLSIGICVPFTVNALGWNWKKESEAEVEIFQDPHSIEVKIKNKGDKELIGDLKEADRIYNENSGTTHQEIYEKLLKHADKREAEVYWRLGRTTYELSKVGSANKTKAALLQEAFEYVTLALSLDDKNFAAHKWMAIILNALSTFKGTKEQISQSYNVRKHMDIASQLHPRDGTSHYMIGNWCYTVAGIPWYQRKIAETLFDTPPTSTYEEAIQHFLKAEEVQPLFYSMNLLMLAKSYVNVGEIEKAAEYLRLLFLTPLLTDEDHAARKEGAELLKKIEKS